MHFREKAVWYKAGGLLFLKPSFLMSKTSFLAEKMGLFLANTINCHRFTATPVPSYREL